MKPPAWRQDAALYPHSFLIQTRYRDEDGLHHINNIAVAAYYDETRARFSRAVFTAANLMDRVRIVTADSRVTYLGEIEQYVLVLADGTRIKAFEQNPETVRPGGARVRVRVAPANVFLLPGSAAGGA